MSEKSLRLSVVFDAIDKASSKLTGIDKSANSVGKALLKAQNELQKLNDLQGDINAFRKLKGAITDNTKKLNEAQAKVSLLAREMKQAERPTREMERAFKGAKREARELSKKVDDDAQSVQRLRDKLKDAGVHTRDLADAQKALKKRIANTTSEVEGQKAALAQLGQSGRLPAQAKGKSGPGSTTDKAVTAGVIMATVREAVDIVAAPVIADADAQEQMTQIGLKADLSREHLQKLRKEVQRLAPEVRATTENLRGGVDFLAASGLDPRAAIKMISPIGKASHAYQAEVPDLAQATNAALSNLKIPLGPNDVDRTKQTARVLEIMAQAGKDGNFEFNDMAKSFPTLTARFSSLGQTGVKSVAELSAALQVAWTATGNADKAANNIDNLLLKINAKETVANFKKFEIDLPAAMQRAYAEGKGPLEAIAELTQKATGGNTDKLSYLFADAQAQTGVLSLIQNMEEYRRIRDNTLSQNSVGMIDRDFDRVSETMASRWDKLQARWSVLKERAGERIRGFSKIAVSVADWLITPTDEKKAQTRGTQLGAKTGDALAEAMRSKQNQLQLSNWWLTVQDATTMRRRSILLGNNVGDGLILGMRQKRGQVQAEAAALAAATDAAARKKLDVHSPSRVFMAIGQHVAEGLAHGITHGRGMAERAAKSMATGVAGASMVSASVAAATGAAGNGGSPVSFGPVEIHIHAAAGMSAEDIAEAVQRKLEELAEARRRSGFSDQD